MFAAEVEYLTPENAIGKPLPNFSTSASSALNRPVETPVKAGKEYEDDLDSTESEFAKFASRTRLRSTRSKEARERKQNEVYEFLKPLEGAVIQVSEENEETTDSEGSEDVLKEALQIREVANDLIEKLGGERIPLDE